MDGASPPPPPPRSWDPLATWLPCALLVLEPPVLGHRGREMTHRGWAGVCRQLKARERMLAPEQQVETELGLFSPHYPRVLVGDHELLLLEQLACLPFSGELITREVLQ